MSKTVVVGDVWDTGINESLRVHTIDGDDVTAQVWNARDGEWTDNYWSGKMSSFQDMIKDTSKQGSGLTAEQSGNTLGV